MFSQHVNRTLAQVEELSQVRPSAFAASIDFHRFDANIAGLFWSAEFGRGGALDETLTASAARVKRTLFDDHVYAIAPLYVTSICMEQCLYCNFRASNKGVGVERIRLSEPEVVQEARFLVESKGLRAIELVYAADPRVRVDSMCRHVESVGRLLDRCGGGMVGVNAEALDEPEYRSLRDAGASFVALWQETYDRERYRQVHPGKTKKAQFEYRLDAYERMIAAGIRRIGTGVLSGLADWRNDWAMLMFHEAYLKRRYGVYPAMLGIPRLKPAPGAVLQYSQLVPTRREFLSCLAAHNIFSPETLPFVSTREDWDYCVELARGGGALFTFNCSTTPGGYSLGRGGQQFPTTSYDVSDYAPKLRRLGVSPVFNWWFSEPAVHDAAS